MQPYQTIRQTAAAPAVASVAEKKSEFIAAAAHVQTEEEAVAFLEQVRARHRTARHNVYAYLLRADGRTRYSDDGEPAKTAGHPLFRRHSAWHGRAGARLHAGGTGGAGRSGRCHRHPLRAYDGRACLPAV